VEKMKTVLEVQTVELQVAEKAANAMLEKLEVSTKDANVKKAEAAVIAEKCAKTAEQIDAEKQIANKELEAAMPFVVAAEKAAKSVNKKDIGIVQKLGKPPDLIKRIMDCVLILMLKPVDKVYLMEIKTGKTETQMFVGDSYDKYAKKVMCASEFIPSLLNFALEEKDLINEETMEFLQPYLDVPDFNAERAKTVAGAAEGLCKWVQAMFSYHKASLIVGPMLEQLQIKTDLFNVAAGKLKKAQDSAQACQDLLDELQATFDATMREKAAYAKRIPPSSAIFSPSVALPLTRPPS